MGEPVPDWLVAILIVFSFSHGFLFAWALCNEGRSSFWRAYLDGLTLRFLWGRKPKAEADIVVRHSSGSSMRIAKGVVTFGSRPGETGV